MTKGINIEQWNYRRNRVVLRSTTDRNDFSSAFSFMTCGPIDVNHLLNRYTLPARKLTKDEWSSRSFDQLHTSISSDYLSNLPSHWHPQKIFEEIITSPHTDFVVNAKTGQGKTTFLLQSSLERVILHPSNYILSFTYAKSLGSTQQQKFHWLRRKLVPDLGRCELYFGGDQATKRRLRNPGKNKKPFAMLTTTIQSYSGSFAHFSPLIPNTKAGYLNSAPEVWGNRRKNPQYRWYEKLRLPTVLLIDELDSLPTHLVPCLAHLTRVLKWHDPTIQVILSSGTLGNPEEVAKHFFTNSSNVKVLSGSGQRGKLEINVYKEGQEDKVEILLQKSIQMIRKHIDHEIQRYNDDRSYRPPKVILFLNHKTKINIKKVTGRFYKHVTTVHGGMESSEVIKRLADFDKNPKLICLVATELIQAGIDLPDVKWGIFYGLPVNAEQQRKFMQLRDRINRNPDEEGRLDVILRERNKVEQSLLTSNSTQKRQEYILREKPISLHIPYYTPISLRYWIVMGILNGFPDVLKYIEEDLTAMDCKWDYHHDLRDAVIDLVLSRAVRIGFDGILLPASGTKEWIYKFICLGTNPSYKVIKVDTVDDTETQIGHIDEVTMLRHHLEGQSFPLGDFNYLVKRIELAGKNRQGKIYVIPAPPEFQFMENKIVSSTQRSRLHAYVKEQGLALMTINISHQLKEIDARTKIPRHIEQYHSSLSHTAVFLRTDPEMDEEESNSLITQLQLELTESLSLDPILFDTRRFFDEELGEGILFLDKTGHDLARMAYYFFKDHSSLLSKVRSSKIHNRGFLGAGCAPPKWLGRFRYKYAMNIVAIPDLRLGTLQQAVRSQFLREEFVGVRTHDHLSIRVDLRLEAPAVQTTHARLKVELNRLLTSSFTGHDNYMRKLPELLKTVRELKERIARLEAQSGND
ncbi:hypothetical protein CEE45_05255 [Candidatus Heimdallarchaeota archaeon B3_Heim]|nr:MAG: hypothetical protein CEE45_05255 [Candidatus Heimdallarchaeota archaeon B3_Heim]